MVFNPPDHHPGDPVKADDINEQNAEIARLGKMIGSPGIITHNGATPQIALDLPRRIFIQLTSSSGANGNYGWAEVMHSAPNSWVTTGYTGTTTADPAYERQTGDTTLTAGSTVYEAERSCCDSAWTFDGKN